MNEALALKRPLAERLRLRILAALRALIEARADVGLSILSAALLILSFPDFELWPLVWFALVPLFWTIAREPKSFRSFALGWLAGTLFFYGSCYWLTYAMIRYGFIPKPVAYALLLPGAIILGLFPGFCCFLLARVIRRFGLRALLLAPFLWTALEGARLAITGQLWNSLGYSQAYVPQLIQTARWGGVYAVSFLIALCNAALVFALISRTRRALLISASTLALIAFLIWFSIPAQRAAAEPKGYIVAVQPNVPMEAHRTLEQDAELLSRHLSLSKSGLSELEKRARADAPRLIVWPESPMYFAYGRDERFRAFISRYAAENRAYVLFNSLQPAPGAGDYNSAVLVNQEGQLVAQYDKIRLLPFGEYVPLPRWLPGVHLIPTMVGDFTPGAQYTLMNVGELKAGVFICFESAFPSLSREFAKAGADALINISNDGYLGPTPVMRQHLANAIFRAVENARPVARVTNTGITAYITERGEVLDATRGFETDVRAWPLYRASEAQTFYTRYGDIFVWACALLSLLIFGTTFFRKS